MDQMNQILEWIKNIDLKQIINFLIAIGIVIFFYLISSCSIFYALKCLEDSRPFRAVHPHVRDNFYFLYYILYRTSIFDCCFRQKGV